MSRKTKCPYSFPAKSKTAMLTYLLNEERRDRLWGSYDGYFFHWNVKAHGVDWGNPKGECTLDPSLDVAWAKEVQGEWVYNAAFEDAQREYSDGEWSSWPGDDQGDWQLGFYGRQGGHLCLESWRGFKFYRKDESEIADWLEQLDHADLRKFYMGIVTADSDFTPAKATENVEYHVNFIRGSWEEQQKDLAEQEAIAFAESYADSRPDLYQGVIA